MLEPSLDGLHRRPTRRELLRQAGRGSHPHVIQPFETYAGRPIVYSLGNFVFDEMLSDNVRRGEVLALDIQGSHLVDWRLRPSYITGGAGQPR